MRNVSNILIWCNILISITSSSCNNLKTLDTQNAKIYYLDVWSNSELDTLITQLNAENGDTKISIIDNNKPMEIVSLMPLFNKDFNLLEPKLENLELQANGVQTEDKGLRVLIRNTDSEPDYYFLDIQYQPNKYQWIVLFLGIINSSPSTDSVYIKRIAINQDVNEFCGSNGICNLSSKILELGMISSITNKIETNTDTSLSKHK